MSIPARKLVNVIPGVLAAGGNIDSLNGVFLSQSTRTPIGTLQGFPSVDAVGAFYGLTSIEYRLAQKYFPGFTNATTLPGTIYFAQYNTTAVPAYLRSGSFAGVSLAQLQELSGSLSIVIDGVPVNSGNIDLSTATSFTNAAELIQQGLQTAGGVFVGSGTIDDGSGAAGNTLTITAVTSGAVHIGDTVTGAGVAPGTVITAFGTGTGGVGTYTVGGAAQLVTPAEELIVTSAALCNYDAQLSRFLIVSPTTGAASTIDFATGTLAAGLKLTQVLGAVLSAGADAATPATFMPNLLLQSLNWATFTTCFEPSTADKLAFAQWNQSTDQRFLYVGWDTDAAPAQGAAPTSFGAQCVAANMVGIYPQWEKADPDNGNGFKGAFICGLVASINWNERQGRTTFAYRGQAGLLPDVSDEPTADNLELNGYNYYADYGTAQGLFVNEQPGSTPGPWKWADSYINQIWLNANLQLAMLRLMTQQKNIPYNTEGYNLYRQAAEDPIRRALFNGVMQIGVTLSQAQRAAVNTATGVDAASALQNNGYYLQILDASPEVRAERGSPPMTLWYTDGGSIQRVVLASIAVQ